MKYDIEVLIMILLVNKYCANVVERSENVCMPVLNGDLACMLHHVDPVRKNVCL